MATRDWYKKFPPRGRASTFAVSVVCVVNDNAISKMEGGDLLTAPVLVDTKLVEVREVLEGLRFFKGGCWCVAAPASTIEAGFRHAKACQRARQLYEKLRTE